MKNQWGSTSLVDQLITEGLHYCCSWAFWELYHDRTLIAARLGMSPATVTTHRTKHSRGGTTCRGCGGRCLKPHLKEIKLILKIRREELILPKP